MLTPRQRPDLASSIQSSVFLSRAFMIAYNVKHDSLWASVKYASVLHRQVRLVRYQSGLPMRRKSYISERFLEIRSWRLDCCQQFLNAHALRIHRLNCMPITGL